MRASSNGQAACRYTGRNTVEAARVIAGSRFLAESQPEQ